MDTKELTKNWNKAVETVSKETPEVKTNLKAGEVDLLDPNTW